MHIERLRKGEIDAEKMKAQTLKSIFPVKTTLKSPRLPTRMAELPPQAASQIIQPMAVIVTDSYSLSWFKQNVDNGRTCLSNSHNAGRSISMNTENGKNRLLEQELLDGMTSYTAHADELADVLLDELGFDPSGSDYKAALKRIESLFEAAEPGTSEGDELERLAAWVEEYEEKHFPILSG